MAAGVNEALVVHLDKLVSGNKTLLSMSSQIVGVLTAAAQKDANAQSMEKGGWVAKNATEYNWLLHKEKEAADTAQEACKSRGGDVTGCQRRITQAMDSLDQARNFERTEQARQVQQAAYLEGMSLGEYQQALDRYWNGIDKSQVVWSGYGPAKEWGYIASSMGAGFIDGAVNWPGKIYDNTVNTLTHLTDIPGNFVQAGKEGIAWLNSPIPGQSIERAGDKLLFSTPDLLGGIVFDAVTGAITAGIGGKAVEWVGGKWVASAPATGAAKEIGISTGKVTPGPINFMGGADQFFKNASKRSDIDADGFFDVVAHGSKQKIEIVTPNGTVMADQRVVSKLIENNPIIMVSQFDYCRVIRALVTLDSLRTWQTKWGWR